MKNLSFLLWGSNDKEGNSVPPGYYFYTIHYSNQLLKGQMIKL